MNILLSCLFFIFLQIFCAFERKENVALAMGAILCQESHILVEWLDHHWSEGVSHFFLVDNCNNTLDQQILAPYVKSGVVTLDVDITKYHQRQLYNSHILPKVRKWGFKWLVIGDLDEFFYAPRGNSIIDVLNSSPFNLCGGIKVPWLMFGTNGLMSNPISVVEAETLREKFTGRNFSNGKSIVRLKYVKSLRIHEHDIIKKRCIPMLNKHGRVAKVDKSRQTIEIISQFGNNYTMFNISEADIPSFLLLVNHYRLQSRDFFQLKKTRGDVHNAKFIEKRLKVDYFEMYDKNEVYDGVLAKRRQASSKRAPI